MISGVPMSRCRRVAAILVCWTALSAAAPGHAVAQHNEVFAGYSLLMDPDNSVLAVTARDNVFPIGWMAGIAHPISNAIALVAEASGYYKSKSTFDDNVTISFHGAMMGPRAAARIGVVSEFVQVLVGAAHGRASAFGQTVSLSTLSLQPGGGVDIPIAHRWAGRIQLDYRWLRHSTSVRPHASQFRAAAAIVYVAR
jgi:hypothetical protein